jgi:uncharacterized protein YkwD
MRRFTTTLATLLGLAAAGFLLLFAPHAEADPCPVGGQLVPGCTTPPTTTPTTPPQVNPPSTTTTTQPKPKPKPAPDTAAAARRLLDLVNGERKARGLAPLARRGDVDSVAVGHSKAMAARYDIWHNDAFFTKASHDALNAAFLGENVAMNMSVEDMHVRLMNSPHHRDNILNGRFSQIGIGVAAAPDGELFATEDFVQPRSTAPAKAAKAPAPVKPGPAKGPVAQAAGTAAVAAASDAPSAELDATSVVALPGLAKAKPKTPAKNHGSGPSGLWFLIVTLVSVAALGGVTRYGAVTLLLH